MFVFRFEKLLRIKSKLLDEKRLQIATVEKEIQKRERIKNELVVENGKRRERLFEILNKKPDLNMILFLNDNIEKTQNAIRFLELEIKELKEKKARFIEEAEALLKEKKKLERLREKRFEEYKKDIEKKEMRFLDEVASIKVASKLINSD